jgi:triacylglycerol lipase
VLVHGLWDTPQLFERLEQHLGGRREKLLIPHLPQRLGLAPVRELAVQLGQQIESAYGHQQPVDLLGFSMGGVISRSWIQLLGGHQRTRRFISVGSPQQGTLTAGPWPRWPLAGIADVKPNSPLLEQLNRELHTLEPVDCSSYYCTPDLMVIPSRSALLPIGRSQQLPVLSHHQLLRHPAALSPLVQELLRP